MGARTSSPEKAVTGRPSYRISPKRPIRYRTGGEGNWNKTACRRYDENPNLPHIILPSSLPLRYSTHLYSTRTPYRKIKGKKKNNESKEIIIIFPGLMHMHMHMHAYIYRTVHKK